jgi:hypothetical protein
MWVLVQRACVDSRKYLNNGHMKIGIWVHILCTMIVMWTFQYVDLSGSITKSGLIIRDEFYHLAKL